jgi:hypothetical protein
MDHLDTPQLENDSAVDERTPGRARALRLDPGTSRRPAAINDPRSPETINVADGNEAHGHCAPPVESGVANDARSSAVPRTDGLPVSRLARRIREEHRLMSDRDTRGDYRPAGTPHAPRKELWSKLAVVALAVGATAMAWKILPWR